MRLVYKQLRKELCKNKIFLGLLMLLTIGTSFMYYFVHFSIDANKAWLRKKSVLSKEEILFQNALNSNTTLAITILLSFLSLAAFVLAIFLCRFMKSHRRQFGAMKSFGFSNQELSRFFVLFIAAIALISSIIALPIGYLASDVLVNANRRSYLVPQIVKGINIFTFLIGTFVPMICLCLIARFCYHVIRNKEIGILLSSSQENQANSCTLKLADKIAKLFPEKRRFAVRLSLRNIIAVLLIIISVMSVSVMFILGFSLNKSSKIVRDSQMNGHYYTYEVQYDTIQKKNPEHKDTITYLKTEASIAKTAKDTKWTLAGVEENSKLFELKDSKGDTIANPTQGEVIISEQLHELYDFEIGENLEFQISDHTVSCKIAGIAMNAVTGWVYVDKSDLTVWMTQPVHAYNGCYSMEDNWKEGNVITREQKLDALDRSSVSNQTSAVINQVMGCMIGCIILFLALLINFQSSTRNILILHLLGYQIKTIRSMLINIYRPIVWIAFFLTLYPSILTAKTILRSLSIQIGDYMPFQTNIYIICGIFLLLNIIYYLVQLIFQFGVRRVIQKENYTDYTEA